MPRTEARVFADVWDDDDWCSLSRNERATYVQLLTLPDLAHCGVVPLREERWAEMAHISLDDLRMDLKGLETINWIVIDQRAGELFVRSLARRDKILRQPKMWNAFAAPIKHIWSTRIRAALLAELIRTRDEGDVNKGIASKLDELIAAIEAQLNRVSGRHLASVSASHPDTDADGHPDTAMGLGGCYGSNHLDAPSPNPQSPSPPPGAGSAGVGSAPVAAAGATAEGEGDSTEALVAEILRLRPEWSEGSVRKVLAHPDVASRRPPSLIRSAALAVARDLATQHPGRLSRDGPWWVVQRGAPATAPPKPPWCGTCHEQSRLTDEDNPRRCPNCHPLKDAR